ncbi:TetR family transcriptional regulator C-terminal domain-containing protein [Tropicimonas sp.]|uniref:TetR family transcriptional regulator C-terminal domain-containing protein n=1 Tax=Tropicimonas sp. TaxID=2067044 RepID=UPI003A84DA78
MTRIQRRNHETILEAALEVFSAKGFFGATLDQIAAEAGLSKPNLLYYFPSKEAMHRALLDGLLESWIEPMRSLDANGDPIPELLAYVRRKLEISRESPRESRLFANEILLGAPHLSELIPDALKPLVDEKAAVIAGWAAEGRIEKVHPYHLIFSMWALTQHYADFDIQVRLMLGPEGGDPFPEAEAYLVTLFTKLLTP